MQGTLLRNCYKEYCGAKGIKDDKLSINSIKSRLNSTRYKSRKSNPNQIPTLLSNFEHHPTSLDYLESVQCLDVYKSNSIHIKYTPRDQRVLFFMNDNTGCVGRYIGDPPKNKNYRNQIPEVLGRANSSFY